MANLKQIKRRIASVANMQKITNAMKLVAAAKFNKAAQAINNARPYSEAFDLMVKKLVASSKSIESSYVQERDEKKSLIIIVATDRGRCGSLNNQLFRAVLQFVAKKPNVMFDYHAWGRKAEQFIKKTNKNLKFSQKGVLDKVSYQFAKERITSIAQEFKDKAYDKIYIVFSEFHSALIQKPRLEQLLPIFIPEDLKKEHALADRYTVEPGLEALIDTLLTRQVMGFTYRALLEGAASEHGARMTAMDAATNNAKEVKRKLTLKYNRARQAAITKELIEIISGAEAL